MEEKAVVQSTKDLIMKANTIGGTK